MGNKKATPSVGTLIELKRSEAVLRLSKDLSALQVAQADPWAIEYRLFIIAGLALEALASELERREKGGQLPSGWPGPKGERGDGR